MAATRECVLGPLRSAPAAEQQAFVTAVAAMPDSELDFRWGGGGGGGTGVGAGWGLPHSDQGFACWAAHSCTSSRAAGCEGGKENERMVMHNGAPPACEPLGYWLAKDLHTALPAAPARRSHSYLHCWLAKRPPWLAPYPSVPAPVRLFPPAAG